MRERRFRQPAGPAPGDAPAGAGRGRRRALGRALGRAGGRARRVVPACPRHRPRRPLRSRPSPLPPPTAGWLPGPFPAPAPRARPAPVAPPGSGRSRRSPFAPFGGGRAQHRHVRRGARGAPERPPRAALRGRGLSGSPCAAHRKDRPCAEYGTWPDPLSAPVVTA